MEIVEVRSPALAKVFCTMPVAIYASDPNFVHPLHSDIEAIFSPLHNQSLRTGVGAGAAKRWLLMATGRPIGRIAAFFHQPAASLSSANLAFAVSGQLKVAGIGFFECIDSQPAASLLFNHAEAWLAALGFNAIDGPINFGERDRWWGLLVNGQNMPNYACHYHPAYYQALFHAAGYKALFEQYTFGRQILTRLPSTVIAKAQRIFANKDYTFHHIKKADLKSFAADFAAVYSQAWATHLGSPQITPKKAYDLAKALKPIIDEDLIWFAYHQGVPVGFVLALPDINIHLQPLQGRFGLWQKLRFTFSRWLRPSIKIVGQAFGIIPTHQSRGLEAALVARLYTAIQNSATKHQYEEIEMNWIGSFNPVMIKMTKQLGAEVVKTHITFRKILDPNLPWQPYPGAN